MGRYVSNALTDHNAEKRLLDSMRHILHGCRLTVNLEGVALSQVPSHLPNLRLGMPAPLVLSWLDSLNVVATGIANNHSMDFGEAGLDDMTRILEAAGRRPMRQGIPVDLGPFRMEAFTDLQNYRSDLASQLTELQVKEAVAKARPPVITLMHWGTEFDSRPTQREQVVAKWLREAKVSLVVGAHPHVADQKLRLLDHEGPVVDYTLGNFLFDQSSKRASGSIVELRFFDQGTFFARVVQIPTFYDLIRSSGHHLSTEYGIGRR